MTPAELNAYYRHLDNIVILRATSPQHVVRAGWKDSLRVAPRFVPRDALKP